MRILAISGSLRARSTNTELLRAVAAIAEPPVEIVLYRGLADLPAFNPDLDAPGQAPPTAVAALRAEVAAADALLICSPEYAHGVPGSLKNALDWLVSGPEVPFKPVGVLNASARATHAQASLVETLRTMSATLVPGASIVVPLDGRRLDAAGIVGDATLVPQLQQVLAALDHAARSAHPERRQGD